MQFRDDRTQGTKIDTSRWGHSAEHHRRIPSLFPLPPLSPHSSRREGSCRHGAQGEGSRSVTRASNQPRRARGEESLATVRAEGGVTGCGTYAGRSSLVACVRRNSSSGHAWEGARRVLPHLLVRTDPRFRCRVHKLPAFLPYLPRRALVTIRPRLLVSVSSPGRPSPHLCERHERRVERRANSHVNLFFPCLTDMWVHRIWFSISH